MDQVKSIQAERWPIVYTADRIQIGCENHSIEEWREAVGIQSLIAKYRRREKFSERRARAVNLKLEWIAPWSRAIATNRVKAEALESLLEETDGITREH